jgi:hypothetical protein
VTLSFLVTTPNAPIGFLMKDVILLGAALYTAGEALAAAPQRRSSAASRPSRTVSQTSPAMHHLARR